MSGDHRDSLDRTLTRRQAVGLGGTAGTALLLSQFGGAASRVLDPLGGATESAQAQTPSCVLTPDKTEGPTSSTSC